MSKGKRFSTLAAATVVALSTVGYFPMTATTHATSSSCAAQSYELAGNELNNLQSGGTYKLEGDASGNLSLGWDNFNKSVTLDLNGCTLYGAVTIDSGTVTIIDSSEDKTGAVSGGNSDNAVRSGQWGGFTITGGTFEKPVAQQSQWSNVKISGGKFVSDNSSYVSQHLANDTYGVFALNDNQVVVEEKLTADNVTFPEDVEMEKGKTEDFVVVVEPGSEALHIDYTPVSNDYFEIENGKITAKKVGQSEVKVTVKQGDTLVAEETVSVDIYQTLQWVRIEDWDDDSYFPGWQYVYPTGGPCMGYRTLEAGKTFALDIQTNLDEGDAEISVETHGESWYDNGELDVVSIDENGNLVAENTGWATIVLTATYNGQTVKSHGHILVESTIHEIVEGDGAEYSGDKLAQKIDADYTKLREVYICPVDAYDKFVEKYGDDEDEWSDEAWEEYYALEELCDTPVDPSNYEVTEGSTVVTFANAWLDTLALGEYEVWYEYTDGYALGTFVIAEKKQNEVEIVSAAVADTGLMTAPVNEGARDTLGATVVAVVATAMAAFATIVSYRKKKM